MQGKGFEHQFSHKKQEVSPVGLSYENKNRNIVRFFPNIKTLFIY